MEDIIGIAVFIVFILIRTLGDRNKGKSKKAAPQRPKPTLVSGRAATGKEKPASGPLSAAPTARRQTVTERTARIGRAGQTEQAARIGRAAETAEEGQVAQLAQALRTAAAARAGQTVTAAAVPQADPEVYHPSYGSLPYPEGYVPPVTALRKEQREESGEESFPSEVVQQSYGLTAQDLRQAIIWSEIIEKPRFKRRQIR